MRRRSEDPKLIEQIDYHEWARCQKSHEQSKNRSKRAQPVQATEVLQEQDVEDTSKSFRRDEISHEGGYSIISNDFSFLEHNSQPGKKNLPPPSSFQESEIIESLDSISGSPESLHERITLTGEKQQAKKNSNEMGISECNRQSDKMTKDLFHEIYADVLHLFNKSNNEAWKNAKQIEESKKLPVFHLESEEEQNEESEVDQIQPINFEIESSCVYFQEQTEERGRSSHEINKESPNSKEVIEINESVNLESRISVESSDSLLFDEERVRGTNTTMNEPLIGKKKPELLIVSQQEEEGRNTILMNMNERQQRAQQQSIESIEHAPPLRKIRHLNDEGTFVIKQEVVNKIKHKMKEIDELLQLITAEDSSLS